MEEEARGLCHPHNDAIVVNLTNSGNKVYHILIDNGSSFDILFKSMLNRMDLVGARMEPTKSTLSGFTRECIDVEGILSLPVELGTHLCQHIRTGNFVVVDCLLVYNM